MLFKLLLKCFYRKMQGIVTYLYYMFPYLEEIEALAHLPTEEQRRALLIRRADKLMDKLRRPEYVYVDESSCGKLAREIRLIIGALEMTVTQEEWLPFLRKMRTARKLLRTELREEGDEAEADERSDYDSAHATLLTALGEFREFISSK